MREIKFRGIVKWNGNHVFSGEWVEGAYAHKELTDTHCILIERIDTNKYGSYFVEIEVNPETIGQCTGLKDKNGKEIYEGDILRNVSNIYVGKEPFKVQWREYYAAYFWVDSDKDEYDYFGQHIAHSCEIIGNIHENPELLEVSE